MRVILGLGGLCGFFLCGWAVIDWVNAAGGGPANETFVGLPAIALNALGVAKFWAGMVLMMLADGFEGLISIARDMRERHPGIPPPGLMERLFGKKKDEDH